MGFFLEHADKFLADDLALALGIGNVLQFIQEAAFGVHANEVDVPFGKSGFHFVAFVFAHQAMIDKYAGELLPHCLSQQRSGYRGIHAAGQG